MRAVRGGREVGQNVKMHGNANGEEGGFRGLGDPTRVAWVLVSTGEYSGTGYWVLVNTRVRAQPSLLLVGRNGACNNDPACHANASQNIN